MRATHRDAEERYTAIRKAVLQEVTQELAGSMQDGLRAGLIDSAALKASQLWQCSSRRKVDWDWIDGFGAFKFRYPKRFEMALWQDGCLMSLSLGRPTYQGQRLRLDFIEGNPERPKGIRLFEVTFLAMVGYAEALGAKELRIMNPINDEVSRYYQRFGFKYVVSGDYLTIWL